MLLTWLQPTPGWVLPGASLDMNFAAGTYYPAGVDSLITVTRAQTVTSYAQTSTGTLTAFAANTLRITDLGLLVEQAATNLALASQTLSSGASWGFVNVTITDNFTTAPDGTATGAKITATSGAARCDTENAIALSNSATYYISVYAKQGTTKFLGFGFYDSSVNQFQSYDLNAGTVQTTTGTEFSNAAITPAGNGWYRLTVKLITPASGALTGVKLMISDTANFNTANATNGITGFYWGLQVETTGFTTSYIPTTTVAVARAADSIPVTSPSVILTASGTIVVKYNLQGTNPNQGEAWAMSDTGNNRLALRTGGSNTTPTFLVGSGSGVGTASGSSTGTGVDVKIASTWGPASAALSQNGAAAVSVGNGWSGTSAGTFWIGRSENATTQPDGFIKRFTSFQTQASNAQLQALST